MQSANITVSGLTSSTSTPVVKLIDLGLARVVSDSLLEIDENVELESQAVSNEQAAAAAAARTNNTAVQSQVTAHGSCLSIFCKC